MESSCLAIKFQFKMNMNAAAVLVFMLAAIGHMAAPSTAGSPPTSEHLLLPAFQGEQEVTSHRKHEPSPDCNICVHCLSTKPEACVCLDMATQCRSGCTECKPHLLPFDFTARYCEDVAVYTCQTIITTP